VPVDSYHAALAEIDLSRSGLSPWHNRPLANPSISLGGPSTWEGLHGHARENTSPARSSRPLQLPAAHNNVTSEENSSCKADEALQSRLEVLPELVVDGVPETGRTSREAGGSPEYENTAILLYTPEQRDSSCDGPLPGYTGSTHGSNTSHARQQCGTTTDLPLPRFEVPQEQRCWRFNGRLHRNAHHEAAAKPGDQTENSKKACSARKDSNSSSFKTRGGTVLPNPHISEVEDASHLWERALQAHAFELSTGQSSPATSRSRRSVSPAIEAVRQPRNVTPRMSLTMPSFRRIDYSGIDQEARRTSQQGESPTASRIRVSPHSGNSFLETSMRRQRSFPAWSQYPSDTREKRNGPAGIDDQVSTFDFAMIPIRPFSIEIAGSGVVKPSFPTGGRENIWKRWKRKYQIHTSDWHRWDRGFRSSISTGRSLSHPELEILPQLTPVFRPEAAVGRPGDLRELQRTPRRKSSLFSGFQLGLHQQDHSDEPLLKGERKRPAQDLEEHISPLDPVPISPKVSNTRLLLHPNDARGRCMFPKIPRKQSAASFQSAVETFPKADSDSVEMYSYWHSSRGNHLCTSLYGSTPAIQNKASMASFHTAVEWIGIDEEDANTISEAHAQARS
jgi:hypothetical protein